MIKAELLVAECSKYEVVAEDIKDLEGKLLIAKYTVMNDYIKDKLIKLGIFRVNVYCYENPTQVDSSMIEASTDDYFGVEQLGIEQSEAKERYESNILSIKAIINDIILGKRLEYEKVSSVVESIYKDLWKRRSIMSCIRHLNNVDDYTFSHSLNTAFYSMLIAQWMGLSEANVKEVIEAGLLHDIGKAKVPLEILNKPGRLTPEEMYEMQKHTIYGYDIVLDEPRISEEVKKAVLMHHERIDGSGYPLKKSNAEINLYSKIVAVADVYDAFTSQRVYKRAETPFQAFEFFMSMGIGTFDISVLKVFLTNISTYYIGADVKLNNGLKGQIAYIPPHDITSPIVNIDSDYVDISKEDIKVEEII